MTEIKNELEYKAIMERIEELLPLVNDETPKYDRNFIELDILSGLANEYEAIHYPIAIPTLPEIIKLRMFEMGLNQTALAKLLHISTSRVSDYMTGKCEPTLKVAKTLCKTLNIDANIILSN